MKKLFIIVLVSTLIFSFASCKKSEDIPADFTVVYVASGVAYYDNYGYVYYTEILDKLSIIELNGTGANINSIYVKFSDNTGYVDFNYTGYDYFNTNYISANGQLVGEMVTKFNWLPLYVQVRISFTDDNGHSITKNINANIDWRVVKK